LFGPGDDWWHNACLNFTTDNWDLYCCGYRDAANMLAEQVLVTQSGQDTLVYPIIFLYRQYLELRLKILIRDGSDLLDRRAQIPVGHKIESLWSHARSLLVEIEPDIVQGLGLAPVESLLGEFAVLDPASTTFRYPLDRKGENPLAALQHLNLLNFRERFDAGSAPLESAAGTLAHYLQARGDMLQELG
jgi:hypothetical protein